MVLGWFAILVASYTILKQAKGNNSMAFTKEANKRNTAKSIEATMRRWGNKMRAAEQAGDAVEYARCKEGRMALIRKWC